MPRIAYVNGRYVAHADAFVHIEDRGYQFADGVYEVCEVARGFIVDMPRHLARLNRSLTELSIDWPVTRGVLPSLVVAATTRQPGLSQVTRWCGRDSVPGGYPVVSDYAKSRSAAAQRSRELGSGHHRAEKSLGSGRHQGYRTANVLAKQKAKEAGAQEAWFVDTDGNVKEGGSSNAWIVTRDGVLVTRPAEHGILRGITRTTMFEVAAKLGLTIEERGFSVAEAKAAREAFISSATTIAMPVVAIDGATVANGHPGSVTLSLRQAFFDVAEKSPA